MRYTISNIDTKIENRELHVLIYVETEWYAFVEVSFKNIIQKIPQISIFELTLLEGLQMEVNSFYKRSERMFNGKIAYEENKIPKDWNIIFEPTFEEIRIKNFPKTLSFQSIHSICKKENNKGSYIEIKTTDDNFYTSKLLIFKSFVGINEDEFHLLKGTFISPIMFRKGETSEYNGRFMQITQDDKIVATFNFIIEGTIDNHYSLYGKQKTKMDTSLDKLNHYKNDDIAHYLSYEKYNGYNDFDDESIDTAFEGDPDTTWNVD